MLAGVLPMVEVIEEAKLYPAVSVMKVKSRSLLNTKTFNPSNY